MLGRCLVGVLLLSCCAARGESVDLAWRTHELRNAERGFSDPVALWNDAQAAIDAATRTGDPHGQLVAVADQAVAAQWLTADRQQTAIRRLASAVARARAAGPREAGALVDLLVQQIAFTIARGQTDRAAADLDEATRLATAQGDAARLSGILVERGWQALVQGDGQAAGERFDAALDVAPNDLARAWILDWKSLAARRLATYSAPTLLTALQLSRSAVQVIEGQDRPVLEAYSLALQSQAKGALGDLDSQFRDLRQFTALNERVATRAPGYDFADSVPVQVIQQFRLADRRVTERLLIRRLVPTWSVALAAVAACVVGTVLAMQVRQKRRLDALSLELQRRNTALRELNRQRTRLLTAACHNLRQPAHALCLLAELSDPGEAGARAPADIPHRLQSIRRCSFLLTDMLGELMDMARLEGGHYQPDITALPLHELLQEVQLHFGDIARQKGLELQVQRPELHVVSDRQMLRRIVFNLVANAVKFTEAGHVRVRVECHPGAVVLSVEDSGLGMAPDRLEDVFEDPARLDAAMASDGLGIGLSIVKRVTDLLGHTFKLESVLGRGTVATLGMPLARPSAAAAPLSPSALPTGRWIALLENDSVAREAMAALLRHWGFAVCGAACGTELQAALAAQGRPALHLVITDLHLSDRDDGLEQVAALRRGSQRERLPALLITGDLDASVAQRAAQQAVLVAHKPIQPRQLLSLIEAAIKLAGRAPAAAVAPTTVQGG